MNAPSTSQTAPRESARPASLGDLDAVADVVVVGGGGGGLPAALFSRWQGNEVILLEKASQLGGTANKAAFWYWIPNNAAMRAAGVQDDRDGYLRYVARLTRPHQYDPDSPTMGLTQWEYDMCAAIYDSASDAAELLAERDALPYRHCGDVPDYWSHLPEDNAPTGRILLPRAARESMSDGGRVGIGTMSAAARRDGVDIRLEHRVQRVIHDGTEVVGVEATTPDGTTVRVGARKAVVFASGGFTHDGDLRANFLGFPAYGGCAAMTNEGDFVQISTAVGAQLRNMSNAWMCPIPLEKAVRRDPTMSGMFSVAGDSMIWVDRTGRRSTNEKLPYNEQGRLFYEWDPVHAAYPKLVQFQIWDQRSQDHSASDEYGRLIVPPGEPDYHVIKGDTLDELAAAIGDRLAEYRHVTGGMTLSEDFADNLRASIERFNRFAEAGVDQDFHRGETPVEFVFNGVVKDEPGRKNDTMWPISGSGPYYAAMVTGGTLDTKGGPRTSPDGEVLDDVGSPIPGLFGVGNCVASASAGAYWAGGATLGPIIAMAYRTARAAAARPVRDLATSTVTAR
ncbi:FAD-dependent oxidoreductase [Georgenia sp. EYE_87]|uniref:FAD-dependent oxidoreductase n=1 Tax=Georgenia sp. EYE_87 TaxID=2853448 RepID=UPI002004713F|nr:FAD-dependent oxidoreductase [Georgenia sp. EYE_87]MCK6211611.1 FAD-dependent oxidoreductase [Georgenia sp. EYE_87]